MFTIVLACFLCAKMSYASVYVFTLNNYSAEELCHVMSPREGYIVVFGKEIAPTTGTPHLQGCVFREDGERFKRLTARGIVGKRAWIDKSDSLEGAIGYCLKEDAWWTNLPDLEKRYSEVNAAKECGRENTWLGSVFLNYPDASISDASHSLHLYLHSL